jgi:hypothetical protein
MVGQNLMSICCIVAGTKPSNINRMREIILLVCAVKSVLTIAKKNNLIGIIRDIASYPKGMDRSRLFFCPQSLKVEVVYRKG